MAKRTTQRTRPAHAAPVAGKTTAEPLPLRAEPVTPAVPKEIGFVATCTVKLTKEIAAKNEMKSQFLAPGSVVKMTRPEAKPWVDSGSFESLAKRRMTEEAANYDKDLGG